MSYPRFRRSWVGAIDSMKKGAARGDLDDRAAASPLAAAGTALCIAAILAGPVAAAIATSPDLDPGLARLCLLAQSAAFAVLAGDYLLRLWRAPKDFHQYDSAAKARRAYARSPLGVVDLLAALGLAAAAALPLGDFAAAPTTLALLRVARYGSGLGLVAAVLRNEARPLLAALLTLLVLLCAVSATMYGFEHRAQPQIFVSVLHSLWWGIVTMGTVGYGDMVPVTAGGRLFGSVTMVLGIALFAVPAGILATGFAAELRRRDFLVTWQAVVKVPLFAQLDASHIARIARLLRAQVMPARSVVVRRGERSDAMFFITEGEVEVEVAPTPVRLASGEYFGELGLLAEGTRTATVTSIDECRLLSLDAADFRRLMSEYPELREAVTRVAEARTAASNSPQSAATPSPASEN